MIDQMTTPKAKEENGKTRGNTLRIRKLIYRGVAANIWPPRPVFLWVQFGKSVTQ